MSQNETAPDDSGGKASESPDRDEKGHFLEGHEVGKDTRFTKDNHPISPGRPKRKHLTDALLKHMNEKASSRDFTRQLADKLGVDPEQATGFDVLVLMAFRHALKGKGEILKQIWDRIEGAVPKSMTLDFDDPVQVYIDSMERATMPDESPDEPTDEQPTDEQPPESDE